MERAALVAGASTRSHSNSMIILIMLIALNLRPFLPMVSDDTGISYGALSLPTIPPMLIFGAFIAVALGPFPRGLRFPDHHGPAIPCCADPHRDRNVTAGWLFHLTVLAVAAPFCLRLDPKNCAKEMGSLGAST